MGLHLPEIRVPVPVYPVLHSYCAYSVVGAVTVRPLVVNNAPVELINCVPPDAALVL